MLGFKLRQAMYARKRMAKETEKRVRIEEESEGSNGLNIMAASAVSIQTARRLDVSRVVMGDR